MEGARDQFATLRFTLVMWIVMGHLLLHERFAGIYDAGFARHEDFGIAGALIVLRFIGIDLFFMLSGFVLTLHYHQHFTQKTKGKEIDRFYLRRLKRIYPMHLAMMAIIGLFVLTGVPHPITSGNEGMVFEHWKYTGLLNLLLMNAWGIIPVASWNEPSWSLSVTFLIYVLFPNLLLILKRVKCPLLAVATLIFAYTIQRELYPFASQSDGAGAIIRGVVFGAMGVAAGLYAVNNKLTYWKHHARTIILGFIALVVLWTYAWQFPLTVFHIFYAPLLFALLSGGFALVPERFSQWGGSRSFALFMVHYPTLLLIRHLLGEWLATLPKLLAYPLTLALVLGTAEIAYRLLDKPFHRLRRK